jgi:cytidylate kinase
MSGFNPSSDEIGFLIERRLHQWEREKDQPMAVHRLADTQTEIDYITISRQCASGGNEIAQILADLLDWQVYDKSILDHMSEDMNVHKSVLESVDEGTSEWIRDWVTDLFVDPPLSHAAYCRHLIKVLLIIAKHKKAIIIGRAAGLVLPRDKGLSVRITAPFEIRCQNYASEKNISLDEASDYVKNNDLAQHSFVKSFLGEDVDDPKHYDIVCNTEKLTPTSVAKLIWRSLDQRKTHSKS